jgi:hypothetical protein
MVAVVTLFELAQSAACLVRWRRGGGNARPCWPVIDEVVFEEAGNGCHRCLRRDALLQFMAAAGSPLSSDEQLSRPPRGFEAARGTKVAGYVGWKSFTAHAPLSDAEMQSPALIDRIIAFARIALPLLEWGWAVVDGETPAPLRIHAPARPLPKPDF